MLTIHTSSLRGNLNETAAPPTSGSGSSDPAGFSSLLRQSQAAAAPVAPPVVAPKAAAPAMRDDAVTRAPEHEPTQANDTEAAADTDEATSNDVANRSRAALKPKTRGDATPHAAKPASEAAGSENKLSDKANAEAAANAAATTAGHALAAPVDPTIAQWLAALQRPAHAAAAGEAEASTTDSAAQALGDAAGTSGKARAGDDAGAVGADPKDKSARGAARFAAAADAAGLAAAGTDARPADTKPEPIGHAATNANSLSAASLPPAPGSAREAAAPVAVALATPVNAPDFAQALGLQLSVLTKDGVQQAELHLNPAEMGPVSVQIVMDGTQARIDFGADVAATRSAIEAGLPELASALRDAGFTLAGGGVSQHSSPRGDGGGQPDGRSPQHARHRVTDDSVARVGAAARRIVTAGGVDLYA